MQKDISALALEMTAFYEGSLHDINHFLKVWAYARMIGDRELPDDESRAVLEAAAVLHDIACPLCREKYGRARGDLQEAEGMPMAEKLLSKLGFGADFIAKVVWLVGHHHTLSDVNTPEHRILLEADYLVNADEAGHSEAQLRSAEKSIFRTATGTALLKSIYG